MLMLRVFGILLASSIAFSQTAPPEQVEAPEASQTALTADAIMARVAVNQDRSEELRGNTSTDNIPHPDPQTER